MPRRARLELDSLLKNLILDGIGFEGPRSRGFSNRDDDNREELLRGLTIVIIVSYVPFINLYPDSCNLYGK